MAAWRCWQLLARAGFEFDAVDPGFDGRVIAFDGFHVVMTSFQRWSRVEFR